MKVNVPPMRLLYGVCVHMYAHAHVYMHTYLHIYASMSLPLSYCTLFLQISLTESGVQVARLTGQSVSPQPTSTGIAGVYC